MAGLINQIKNDVKKAGTNKGKFIYFREGQKQRVRFLVDMDDGMEVKFHDSFEQGINAPCQEIFGRDCPYCDDDSLRTRSQYIWSVYNYEAKEVQLFMFPVNNCTPIPALMSMYEEFGTLTDRDYVISVQGKAQNKSYTVVPMDKVKFRNEKAKPYPERTILKMLDKAWPCDATSSDDDFMNKPTKKKPQAKSRAKQEYDAEDDKLPENDELCEMSARELFNLCKERDIDCKPKKDAEYYVDLLEDWRAENEASEDSDDDCDDWDSDGDGEEKTDYESKSAQELYKMCKSRGLEVQPKKPVKYYVKQLQDDDAAHDDWDDTEETEGSDGEDDWEDE